MTIESMIEKRKLRRKVEGIAAALLPFEADGSVAVEAFQRHLVATRRAGLMNAVNMDTGNVNYLSDAEKCNVLRWTREALAGETPIGRLAFPVAFGAGAAIGGQSGDFLWLDGREMERIVEFGGVPILFQTARLHGKSAEEKASAYRT